MILKETDFSELPKEIVLQVDLRFSYLLSSLRNTAANLRSLATLLLIMMGSGTAYGLANICKGISASKAIPISAVYGDLSELLGMLCISFLVLAILYSIRWRIMSAASRREQLWQTVKSELQFLLNPPH